MKVQTLSSVLGLFGGLAVSFAALADNPPGSKDKLQGAGMTEDQAKTATESIDEANYVGRKLVDRTGKSIGEVEDLMIHKTDGQVYAVVDVGGFLGIGAKEVALPVTDLSVGADYVILMSQKDEAALKAMPEIDRSNFKAYGGKTKKEGSKY